MIWLGATAPAIGRRKAILAAVRAGAFSPTGAPTQAALARRFGVSKMRLHHDITVLAEAGLVARDGRGRLSPVTMESTQYFAVERGPDGCDRVAATPFAVSGEALP